MRLAKRSAGVSLRWQFCSHILGVSDHGCRNADKFTFSHHIRNGYWGVVRSHAWRWMASEVQEARARGPFDCDPKQDPLPCRPDTYFLCGILSSDLVFYYSDQWQLT